VAHGAIRWHVAPDELIRMDLLDRLLGHDAWTTRELLLRSASLTDEQLDRPFPIGHATLRVTFDHIIWNIEVWTDLMCGRPRRSHPGPGATSIPRFLDRLDAAYAEFAAVARRIQAEGRLDDTLADTVESPPVMQSFGGCIAHVITHSMHHRAQILNMMRHLGMNELIEGDVLGWEAAHAPVGWKRPPGR
jgi:uncharacterized damage-inducible protein DinB